MKKRAITLVLLFVFAIFYSCSTKKEVFFPEKEHNTFQEADGVSYEEKLNEHYEKQSSAFRRNMTSTVKSTPLSKRKKMLGKRRSCAEVNDAVVNDGVKDTRE